MVKNVFKWLLRNGPFSRILAVLWLLKENSFLQEAGWFRSVRLAEPVDKNGSEIPWYTYSAIDFLTPRIDRAMRVFEYGSGNSTVWWARRVASVVSCEHDPVWFEKMAEKLPDNVTYLQHSIADGYADAIKQYDKEFDVIVIDGRDRIACAKNCLHALRESGVVVWDNSDRARYQEGYDFLVSNGFRRIDFVGPGPIVPIVWGTSVFYRTDNGIGI